jgi:hypothetical protein
MLLLFDDKGINKKNSKFFAVVPFGLILLLLPS